MIKCLVCGKPQKLITPKHLGTHGLTAEQYRTKFPGAPMSSKAFRRRRADVMTERWQDPDNLEHMRESCRKVQLAAWEGNDERRAAQAERAREKLSPLWDDPEWRAQRSEDQREKATEFWTRPDYREKVSTAQNLASEKRARENGWLDRRATRRFIVRLQQRVPSDQYRTGWFYAVLLVPEIPRVKFGYSRGLKLRFETFYTLCPDMLLLSCWPAEPEDETIGFEIAKRAGAKLVGGEVYLVENIEKVIRALDKHFVSA